MHGTRRWSLLTRFGIVSGVLVLGLGTVLALALRDVVETQTLADAERAAVVAARLGVQPLLRPDDLDRGFVPLDDARLATLDRALRSGVSDAELVRIKVWNREHWIVYSDHRPLLGRWFAAERTLAESLDGAVTSEVTDLSRPEELEERDFGTLLAVYVPLLVDDAGAFTADPSGDVVGAFELYLPYAPIAASIRTQTLVLVGILAVGLAVLHLGLFRLVAAASRTLQRQAAQNAWLAHHDTLTGLGNRVQFLQAVESRLHADGAAAVLLLDLDRFQEVNDALGHESGDLLLRAVGKRLTDAVGERGLARLGGDEFALVVERPGVDPARQVGEEVRAALEAPFEVAGLTLDVRASVGIAVAPLHGEDAETLLRRADVAMYAAKRRRAGVVVYAQEHDHHSPRRLALATEMRRALKAGELVLHYQPQLDLRTGEVVAVEALVRWQHPTLGLLPPSEFLPVIETTELMRPLTLHVLELALAQVAAWEERGLRLDVAVNVSARSLHDRRLPGEVLAALERHGLEPARLELELTESALLDDPAGAATVTQRLYVSGVRMAVDDFGTGYASMAYLRQLPLDALKIDRSFVAALPQGGQDAVIVRFSVDLARTLGMRVVAEGVEDDAVLAALTELGVDLAQGFGIARPMPADALAAWMRARRTAAVAVGGGR